MPQKKILPKIERINPKSSSPKTVLGFSPQEVLDYFNKRPYKPPAESRKLRLYKSRGIYFIQRTDDFGEQAFFQIIKKGKSIQFKEAGRSGKLFEHRFVFPEFRNKEIGSRMLKTYLAFEKKQQRFNEIELSTTKRSTAILLLKNGFKLDARFSGTKYLFKKFPQLSKNPSKAEQNLIQIIKKNRREKLPFGLRLKRKL